MSDHKKCRFCGAYLMKPGALKCPQCSEFQTVVWQLWSRFGLSDLTMFIAILTLSWTYLGDLVRGEKASISIRVLSCNASYIGVAVFNSGSQPGILSDLNLVIVDEKDKNNSIDKFSLSENSDGNNISELKVVPKEPLLLSYPVSREIKGAVFESCSTRIVAKKYEESKPKGSLIDIPACSCSQLI